MTDFSKPSQVESIKVSSDYLRGNIAEGLADGSPSFAEESVQLLKHHGTYQQDDRDARKAARAAGKGKVYIFMVRTKLPAGKLSSERLLAELDLADRFGNGTLRITSRQGFQLHGVLKHNLQATIRGINEAGMTTLGACGDVNRNVMCCPKPSASRVYDQIQQFAGTIAEHLAPRTAAYRELWLIDPDSGEKEKVADVGNGGEVEPIYGQAYMPRKFKTAIALPHDNCIDLYTHDLGFLAITEGDEIIGYNVLVGGGFGVTPSAKKTFPALASKMCFVEPDRALDVATAVVKVQRDFGNRSDRKVARLKYLVSDWGVDRFKAKVEEYLGASLPPPTEHDVYGFDDHMGWSEQGDGRWFYGLNVENGRIADRNGMRMKSALREVSRALNPGVRLTAHQSLLLTDLEDSQRPELERLLRHHGVRLTEEISTVRRWSMACVALPTCGLSITDAERALPGIVDRLEIELAKLGLSSDELTVRMTGCPNGCARPYNADVGLVGKARGKYTLFLGGRLLGDRLNFIYKDLVSEEEVVAELVPVFTYFKQQRQDGEGLGDFCHRKGKDDLLAWSRRFQAEVTR